MLFPAIANKPLLAEVLGFREIVLSAGVLVRYNR